MVQPDLVIREASCLVVAFPSVRLRRQKTSVHRYLAEPGLETKIGKHDMMRFFSGRAAHLQEKETGRGQKNMRRDKKDY